MTAQELAQKLDGREYGSEITKEEEAEAKAAGLVVVFGYSDDDLEFRGAIDDEFGCYGGGTVAFDENGQLEACDENCKYFQAAEEATSKVTGEWSTNGYSWYINTDGTRCAFDVMEDGEKYCRGIVFELKGGAK